jgi:hypothetical protein
MFSRCELCDAQRPTIYDCYVLMVKKEDGKYEQKHVCKKCAGRDTE